MAIDKNDIVNVICQGNDSYDDTYYMKKLDGKWEFEVLEDFGDMIRSHMLCMDNNNMPHFVTVGSNVNYNYLHDNTWRVSSFGDRGATIPSLALDDSDLPHIAYFEKGLKYAHWDGYNWIINAITDDFIIGFTSIALDSQYNPHIAYYLDYSADRRQNGDLNYAYWTGSRWVVETVDSQDVVGKYPTIQIDSNDDPHICYQSETESSVRHAWKTGNEWSIETIDKSESDAGLGAHLSMDIDQNDDIHVSYRCENIADNTDHVMYANNIEGTWTIFVVDNGGPGYGGGTSIKLDSLSNVHICYYDHTSDSIKYAKNTHFDFDKDEMLNDEDTFPNDPSASQDTDNDGYPDSWNDGKSQDDSTTGLTLDAFPDDPEEWDDTDSDGVGDNSDVFPEDSEEWADTDNDSIGDNSDAFPDDPAASIDSDDDGMPDSWNDGFGPEDSTSDPPLVIDLYPNDPDNEATDDDDDSTGDDDADDDDTGSSGSDGSTMGMLLIVGLVAAIAIAAFLFFGKKKEPVGKLEDANDGLEKRDD